MGNKIKTTKCTRCGGSGQFQGYGLCFKCGGSGRMKAPRAVNLVRLLRKNRDQLIEAVKAAKAAGTGDPRTMADTVQRARRINHNLVKALREQS